MSLLGASIASSLSGCTADDLLALALQGGLSIWHDGNRHPYFDLKEIQALAEPYSVTTDRLFELTGSEKEPRSGSIWRASLWDHENRQADQLGTPEMWQELADEALERAWRDLESGNYGERLCDTLRRRSRPTLQVQRQALEAAQRAIQSPLIASVDGKHSRGRPRSAAWSLNTASLAEMHRARVPISDQAVALGVSEDTIWRRRRKAGLSYKEAS